MIVSLLFLIKRHLHWPKFANQFCQNAAYWGLKSLPSCIIGQNFWLIMLICNAPVKGTAYITNIDFWKMVIFCNQQTSHLRGAVRKKPLPIVGIREKPMGGTHFTNNWDIFFILCYFEHIFFMKKVEMGSGPPPLVVSKSQIWPLIF